MTEIPLERLNCLEMEYFSLLNYKLHVSPDEYLSMVESIGHSYVSMTTYQRDMTDTISRYERRIQLTVVKFEQSLECTIQKLSQKVRQTPPAALTVASG